MLALGLLGAGLALNGAARGGVEYVGLDTVHLTWAGGGAGTFRLELWRNDVRLVEVAGGSFNGSFQDKGLAPGTHTYQVHDHYRPPEPPPAAPEVRIITLATVTVTGREARGNLLFDETLADTGPIVLEVGVGAGRTLRLERTTVSNGHVLGPGRLELTDAALGETIVDLPSAPVLFLGPVAGGDFHFRHPQDIAQLRDARVRFYDGSSPGRFRDGTRLDVTLAAGNVEFENCTGTVLRLRDGADVRLSKGSLVGWFCEAGVRASLQAVETDIALVDWPASIMPYPERWEPGSRVVFDRCQVFQRGPCHLYPADVEYRDCLFQEPVIVNGRQPRFLRGEFGSWVQLEDRTGAVFEDCLFHRELVFHRYRGPRLGDGNSPWGNRRWDEADPATPTVRNNSFLGNIGPVYAWSAHEQTVGEVRPPHAPILIGPNYYGEVTGPERIGPDASPVAFLSGLGAKVVMAGWLGGWQPFFTLDPFQATGRRSRDPRVFPSFWLDGWVAGQHALNHAHQGATVAHSRIQGKETLLSVLVGTSAAEARGVKLRVEFDGQQVEPAAGLLTPVVHGSLGGVQPSLIANGRATFDFILPPVGKPRAPLEIWLDTTGVEGYPDAPKAGSETLVLSTQLDFDPPPAQPLRLLVQPVHIVGYGAPADPLGFALDLRDLLAAMLPLRAGHDIDLRLASSTVPYTPGAASTRSLSLYPLAAAIATGNRMAGLADWWGGTRNEPHFTVALLPAGILGSGVEGVNMKVFRGTLFVTEDTFKATVHELGHAGPGLYTATEQYDLPACRADGGKRLAGMTAFINQPGSTLDLGAPGRFLHLPGPFYAWKPPVKLLDIMGAQEPSWIDTATLADFRDWLTGLLGSAPSPRQPATVSGSVRLAADPPQPGFQRLLLSLRTVQHPAATRHLPDLGSVRLFEVSSFARYRTGLLREPAFTDYHIVAFDAAGQTVFFQGFDLADETSPTRPPPGEASSWSVTCDVPVDAVRIEVRDRRFPDLVYFDHTMGAPGPGLQTTLLEPVAGSSLGGQVAVRWVAGSVESPPLRSQPLQHLLLVSHDRGANWEPATGQIEGGSITLSTLGWPAGDGKSLRLLTSDGFRTVEARVDNLRLPNRAPRVTMVRPKAGDRAMAGYAWTLEARVDDPDGDPVAEGLWNSSLDGVLGSGRILAGVELRPGTHTLTHVAIDDSGNSGHASIQVEVVRDGNRPVPLPADALIVLRPGKDRHEQAWCPLEPGQVHHAGLTVRAPGEAVTLRLRLFLKAPGQPETLHSETIAPLDPFASGFTGADFLPATPGVYRFRATVDHGQAADPEEETPGWTWSAAGERTWDLATSDSSLLTVVTEGEGSVVVVPDGLVAAGRFSGWFHRGRTLLLLAMPAPGWRLDAWTGLTPTGPNSARFLVGEAREVRVRFARGVGSGTGSLLVRLRDAVPGAERMEWRVLGAGGWMAAGAVRDGLPEGACLIGFRDVPGHPEVPLHLLEMAGGGLQIHEHGIPTFAVDVGLRPLEGGRVSGAGSHLPGQTLVLEAHPSPDHLFAGWTEGGLPMGSEPVLTFRAVRHRQLLAHFTRTIGLSSLEALQRIGTDPAHPVDGVYHLTGPLDASMTATWDGGRGFRPIAEFLGTLDGRGHAITGLTIDRPDLDEVGLIGRNGGTVANLVLAGGSIRGHLSVGGLVGHNDGQIRDCAVAMAVTGAWHVGGVAGRNRGADRVIERCASSGPVTGGSIVGGLVGLNEFGATVRDALATGPVAGADRVGGLIGRVYEAAVLRCYATGPVTGTGSVGGLIGSRSIDDPVQASFWDTQTSGQNGSAGGTGRSTGPLQQRATFANAGWDFVTVWAIEEGRTHPWLRRSWETVPTPPRPPRILGLVLESGVPILTLATEPGRVYVLERSADLTHWSVVQVHPATHEETRFDGAGFEDWGGPAWRFYRARMAAP